MQTSLKTFFTLLILAFSIPFLAQRNCGTTEHLVHQMQSNPKLKHKMDLIEKATKDFEKKSVSSRNSGIITIPVVVHIVYKNGTENISDAQIFSQIDILNEDFRRMNADSVNTPLEFLGVAADSEFEFCLATVNPQGGPTTGITRTETTVSSFSSISNTVKFTSTGGIDAWPRSKYLNIWVCDLTGSLLGYAQFPGGIAATDGVVNDYLYFGDIGTATAPFDKGRTLTHEVGHWLNLRHIWGDGNCNEDDFVDDTPTAKNPNYTGSPCTFPGPNSCNQGVNDLPDMFQNYMDYSDDGCMNLFTEGQKVRMKALFAEGGFRESLLTSNGCGTPMPPTCDDGIQNGNETGVDCGGPECDDCPPCLDVVINITFDDFPEETSWEIRNSNSDIVAEGGSYGIHPDGSSIKLIECLPDDCYEFTIRDSYGDGICCGTWGDGAYEVSINGEVVATGGEFEFEESSSFCISTTYIFEGPGTDWKTASNWNMNQVPPVGFNGKIIISSDCVLSGKGILNVSGDLIISSGVTLIQN